MKLFLWGHLHVSVCFFLHTVGCVYLFITTYLTDLSFPQCTACSEALLLVSDISFAIKDSSVSRISTLQSKKPVFDPGWCWDLKLCSLKALPVLLLVSRLLCFLGVKPFYQYSTCWDTTCDSMRDAEMVSWLKK